MSHPYPLEAFVTGLTSPEGPAFDADGNLFFVNWLTSSIMRATPDGEVTEYFNTGGIPAGLAFHPDGSLYVADEGDEIHGLMRITPTARRRFWSTSSKACRSTAPTTSSSMPTASSTSPIRGRHRWRIRSAGSIAIFPDGRLEQLDTGLAFPNGVAITKDGSAVILAETMRNRLLRYELRADGSVGPRTVWAENLRTVRRRRHGLRRRWKSLRRSFQWQCGRYLRPVRDDDRQD